MLQNDLHHRLINVTKPNGVEVLVQDQTTDIVDYFLCIQIQDLELAIPTVIDEKTATVVDATGVIAGTYVCFQEGARAFQAKILGVAGEVLTFDTPLDFNFSINANVANRDPQLAVDGSVTPVVATLAPVSGVKWDVTRIIMSMTHAAAADDGKFGGITALTNGIVLRKADAIHHTIFNAKTNGDLRERMYDVVFSDRAPAGQYGTSARRSFGGPDKNGVVIRLDGDADESFQIIIQDDLTGLTSFRVVAQGHIVED